MLSFLHPCRILRIPACYDKPFKYFYRDVWDEYAIPESKSFPLFENGPHKLYASLILWLVFLHLVLENLMKLRSKPFNYRPLLLVFNSLNFVINFLGFVILGCVLTNIGYSFWDCTFGFEAAKRPLMLKLGYAYLLTKLIELLRPAFYVIRGFSPHKLDTFGQVIYIMLGYKAFLFHPFGAHCWVLLVDLLYHTFVYVYLIFSCTGTKLMKPTKYKNYMPFLNMMKFASMFAHSSVTFLTCDGYYYLKLVAIIYSLTGFICSTIYMVDIVDAEYERRKQLKKD